MLSCMPLPKFIIPARRDVCPSNRGPKSLLYITSTSLVLYTQLASASPIRVSSFPSTQENPIQEEKKKKREWKTLLSLPSLLLPLDLDVVVVRPLVVLGLDLEDKRGHVSVVLWVVKVIQDEGI